MISVYGRSTVAPQRKHNHFVPNGYIPPKNRQKIVSPPKRTKTILKSPGSSRHQTPNGRPNPNSRVSPHPRVSPQNQNVRPQSSPVLKSILKSSKVSQNNNQGSTPSPRVKSAGTSPHSTPAWSQSSGCYAGGEEYARPPSRQMNAKVQESIGRGPYDGKPISVVDKYDERDNPIWWKGLCPPARRGPPAKSSLRPHARRPNIIFNRVVNSQGESSSSQSFCEPDDEEEDPKLREPCCGPVDWDRDAILRSIASDDDRQAYRQCKLEEYLREVCTRCDPPERFANYLIRCYAYANEELNSHRSKHLLGYVDEHLSPLDVWVLRLHRGTVSRLLRFSDSCVFST